MAHRLTLILGGARSGKSRHAEELAAASGGRVLYVATAEALDEEMAARIATHREKRGRAWETLEAPRDVGAAILGAAQEPDTLLLDCVTLLASNLFGEEAEEDEEAQAAGERGLVEEVDALLAAYRKTQAHWIIVSNEVGLGLVPPYPLGRIYRDALGRANQRLAAAADEVVFMVAGLPLIIKGKKDLG